MGKEKQEKAKPEKELKEEKPSEEKEICELEQAQALAEDYKRKWYSVSAEYDNYRKRNAMGLSRAYSDGVAEAVVKLLPVADNFGYALDSASDEKTRAGIDKVIKSFNSILSSMGVEEIPLEVGDEFDESVAEAVMNFPAEEGEKPNTVKQVIKKGYRSGEKVIRFAQVAVIV
ncbi:MAG: nucleotide exchange factor GrpE [Clostridia bacterium]|nr:nucleotide exchange factor GrpE [Clostridia bacterium]